MADTDSISGSWPARARRRAASKPATSSSEQGDPAEELFIIKSGRSKSGSAIACSTRLPELSIFGEMALIDHGPRSATAVAATDATLVPVGEKQFLFLVSRTPYFAINVMRVLVQRLRTSNSVIY